MADTDTTQDTTVDTEQDTDALDTTTAEPDKDTDESADTEPDKVDRAELLKIIKQRDKIKAELRALKNPDKDKDGKDTEPSEADTLRTALRRTAAVSVLSERGIKDKADQDKILSAFGLDNLEVDGADVDTDTLADYLDTMERLFGGGQRKRTAPAVDTRRTSRDNGDGADPDTRRYRKFVTGRG